MATLNMTVTPNPAAAGQQVTATYDVVGADDVPASSRVIAIDGTTVVDGVELDADVQLTLTKPAVVHTREYLAPTAPGMTFSATADPRVWVATAPSA